MGLRTAGETLDFVTDQQDKFDRPAAREVTTETPVARQALHELAWSEPMLKVAVQIGVSATHDDW